MHEYKMPTREQNSNKGTFGKVLNIAGSKNYVGAAYLSTYATLKVGAGYCALAGSPDVNRVVAGLLPEAVYLGRQDCLKKLNNFSVLLIGCGLGNDCKVFKQTIKQLQKETMPVVIDADGLNILAEYIKKNNKGILRFAQNDAKHLILTPHPLEAARLLGLGLNEVLTDLEGSAKRLADKYNCVVVLKTHRTIICDKENLFINRHGNSALAKAGSGDVLAGIIAGLLAQGMNKELGLFETAKLGVYLHSRAGEIASEELTEYSVMASDLPKFLHKAIKEIL